MDIDLSPIIGDHKPEEVFESSIRSILFVCDDESKGYCCFLLDTSGFGADKTFIIDNPAHKEIVLMRIDGVLFMGKSKCDCAILFDNECDFVELKTYAANRSEESMDVQYMKSYNQLKLTVLEFESLFDAKNQSFRSLFERMQAYAVFNPTVPKDNATQKKLSAQFAKDVKMKLNYTNVKKI